MPYDHAIFASEQSADTYNYVIIYGCVIRDAHTPDLYAYTGFAAVTGQSA